ncbi:putative SOS response-associated peptidase YedK [Comamonas sp. BIGb0124]|uniref:SOS response-associated peptidase n=1 Tax=Comamonas sp. BIGb0124 TaxID=2485130 RepID=UPI000F479569|nr:SOS response-associated peptidase [Comamonas sp. BIGb0124]ROR25175.1 putative SOS response-associated peptidase YedK [Comamonas sp. BIGb0124]
MCSHYRPVTDVQRYRSFFGAVLPNGTRPDLWPGYVGSFIRRPRESDAGDEAVAQHEALPGVFGLIPHWAKDTKISRQTYNARSETVAEKPSFRDAWRRAQHCIIPADWIYEPDWRSGKAVPTRIQRADGHPMGIAGLWASCKLGDEWVHSFTMLTVNADDHELMRNFHKPHDEKRMVVILGEGSYDAWLDSLPGPASSDFMRQYPAGNLIASPEK